MKGLRKDHPGLPGWPYTNDSVLIRDTQGKGHEEKP